MKRSNKLYEALAIVSQCQNRLSFGLNGLKFDKETRAILSEDCHKSYEALEHLSHVLEHLLEKETGLTEKKKWENAARVLGGSK